MSSSSDSSSASSSSGEEEDDAATQKSRIEESGGGGGTAEEGGEEASSPDRGDEILLPWKTQVHFPRLKQRVKLSKFLLESLLPRRIKFPPREFCYSVLHAFQGSRS